MIANDPELRAAMMANPEALQAEVAGLRGEER